MTIEKIVIAGSSKYNIVIESEREPTFIQIDPYYRIPQRRINNDSWEVSG